MAVRTLPIAPSDRPRPRHTPLLAPSMGAYHVMAMLEVLACAFPPPSEYPLLTPPLLTLLLISQALVEHCSALGRPERVERCVLHLDVLSLDLDQVRDMGSISGSRYGQARACWAICAAPGRAEPGS